MTNANHSCPLFGRGLALIVVAVVYATGCGGGNPPVQSRGTGARLAAPSELTAAQRAWGVGPKRSADVTYQPEVVIIDEGPEAIRGMSANGIEWTIDAAASGAGDLKPGRILFATSRAVGRVLGVRRDGSNLAVTLGPVALTEVVRDAVITVDQPIDFTNAIEYTAPDLPGTSSAAAPLQARAPIGSEASLRFVRATARDTVQAGFWRVSSTTLGDFQVTPAVSLSGIGAQVTSDAAGLRFVGKTTLRLEQPRLSFSLEISKGTLRRCELRLIGAAGLLMELDAASERGSKGDAARTLHLPTDFSIPLLGEAVPFAVTLRQSFVVKTRFGAPGALHARGDYAVTGGFDVGYRNGRLGVTGPAGFTANESLIDSINGVSMMPSGLLLTHQVRVIVGIGAFGFVTGPYFALTSAMGVSRHSDLDTLARCRGDVVNITVGAGVGYFMPRVITDGINTVLRALNLGEVANEGGITLLEPTKLINQSNITPKIKACGA